MRQVTLILTLALALLLGAFGGESVAQIKGSGDEQYSQLKTNPDEGSRKRLSKLATVFQKAYEERGAERGARVAVMAFKNLGATSEKKKLGEVVSEHLTNNFANSEAFQAIERSQVDQILGQMRMERMLGRSDVDIAQQVGSLLETEYMVIGSVSEIGNELVVAARLVQTSDARIILSVQVILDRNDFLTEAERWVTLHSRIDGIYRSLVLPGWGQIYNGDLIKGGVFTSLFAITVVGGFYEWNQAVQAENKYNKDTPDSVKYFDDIERHKDNARFFIYGAGLVWAVNIADAVLLGRDGFSVEPPEDDEAPKEEEAFLRSRKVQTTFFWAPHEDADSGVFGIRSEF